MPLLKCQSSKSTPQKVMAYVTAKNKAEFVSVRNLFEDEDYAEQFEETAKRFGKGEKFEERKYYHFKLSCDRKDKVCPPTYPCRISLILLFVSLIFLRISDSCGLASSAIISSDNIDLKIRSSSFLLGKRRENNASSVVSKSLSVLI